MKPLVIRFNKDTSERDVEDLMILLEDISKRYNFNWFKDTYAKDNAENTKSNPTYISTCCAFSVHKDQSDEGTFTYVCDCCGKDCDVRNTQNELNSQQKTNMQSCKDMDVGVKSEQSRNQLSTEDNADTKVQNQINKDWEQSNNE